jgi:hypothetical protein
MTAFQIAAASLALVSVASAFSFPCILTLAIRRRAWGAAALSAIFVATSLATGAASYVAAAA